uniref:Uncharacterized protein n=1 Tax=Anguilla anguilla TaxID=7936 RepID=A0A0E9RML3_ANGAN
MTELCVHSLPISGHDSFWDKWLQREFLIGWVCSIASLVQI